MISPIFTPCQIGPIEIRNRTIRSAAFENMCKDNAPTEMLFDYHTAVSRGGIGMTTIAYAAVNKSGVSFNGQLFMRKEIVPELKELTDAIHKEGAKAAIQLGHCGNMTHRYSCGQMPVGASGGINIYSPTLVRALKKAEILALVTDFGNAVKLSKDAGFDCVEIHAGHGYLISQFLSPYTNKRKDEFGGSLENRMKFMKMVMAEVLKAASNDMAVVVKTNMYDGFKGGLTMDECLVVAQELEKTGAHALVLTAGFVSKAPMEILRGAMPLKALTHYMDPVRFWWLKLGIGMVGRWMIPTVPYKEAYFLESAKLFRKELKIPLIYVGGVLSKSIMEEVLNEGFVAFQLARPLIHDTEFINKIKYGEIEKSYCKHSNYCIGIMYSIEMKCHHCVDKMPKRLQKEVENQEAMWK
jgi:2,4-dienoyl-CoA reductase-like NADH-dependent reductase (Old Yellow Enzyme family)